MNDILEVRHLVKRFGDVTAVDDLSVRGRFTASGARHFPAVLRS